MGVFASQRPIASAASAGPSGIVGGKPPVFSKVFSIRLLPIQQARLQVILFLHLRVIVSFWPIADLEYLRLIQRFC